MGASVQTDKTAASIVEMLKEIRRMQQEPVPAKELERVKLAITMDLVRSQQKVQGMAGQAGNIEVYGLSNETLTNADEKIRAVTIEDIRRIARKYLSADNLQIVIAGDAASVCEQFKDNPSVKLRVFDGEQNQISCPAPSPVAPAPAS